VHSMAQPLLDQGASSLRATLGRYHYNVSTCRLDVHVTKGRADGLHVSSMGAAGELWAVIMDAGTQFTAQVRHWSHVTARTLHGKTLHVAKHGQGALGGRCA